MSSSPSDRDLLYQSSINFYTNRSRHSPMASGYNTIPGKGHHMPRGNGNRIPTGNVHHILIENNHRMPTGNGYYIPTENGQHLQTANGQHVPIGSGHCPPTMNGHHTPVGNGYSTPTTNGHPPKGSGHSTPTGNGHSTPTANGNHTPIANGHITPSGNDQHTQKGSDNHLPIANGHRKPSWTNQYTPLTKRDIKQLLIGSSPKNRTCILAVVLADFTSRGSTEISVRKGDEIYVMFQLNDWAYVACLSDPDTKGYIPLDYCLQIEDFYTGATASLTQNTEDNQRNQDLKSGLRRSSSSVQTRPTEPVKRALFPDYAGKHNISDGHNTFPRRTRANMSQTSGPLSVNHVTHPSQLTTGSAPQNNIPPASNMRGIQPLPRPATVGQASEQVSGNSKFSKAFAKSYSSILYQQSKLNMEIISTSTSRSVTTSSQTSNASSAPRNNRQTNGRLTSFPPSHVKHSPVRTNTLPPRTSKYQPILANQKHKNDFSKGLKPAILLPFAKLPATKGEIYNNKRSSVGRSRDRYHSDLSDLNRRLSLSLETLHEASELEEPLLSHRTDCSSSFTISDTPNTESAPQPNLHKIISKLQSKIKDESEVTFRRQITSVTSATSSLGEDNDSVFTDNEMADSGVRTLTPTSNSSNKFSPRVNATSPDDIYTATPIILTERDISPTASTTHCLEESVETELLQTRSSSQIPVDNSDANAKKAPSTGVNLVESEHILVPYMTDKMDQNIDLPGELKFLQMLRALNLTTGGHEPILLPPPEQFGSESEGPQPIPQVSTDDGSSVNPVTANEIILSALPSPASNSALPIDQCPYCIYQHMEHTNSSIILPPEDVSCNNSLVTTSNDCTSRSIRSGGDQEDGDSVFSSQTDTKTEDHMLTLTPPAVRIASDSSEEQIGVSRAGRVRRSKSDVGPFNSFSRINGLRKSRLHLHDEYLFEPINAKEVAMSTNHNTVNYNNEPIAAPNQDTQSLTTTAAVASNRQAKMSTEVATVTNQHKELFTRADTLSPTELTSGVEVASTDKTEAYSMSQDNQVTALTDSSDSTTSEGVIHL